MIVYWAETVQDGHVSCHLATLTPWPTLGPQNTATVCMDPAVLTALNTNTLACHVMAVLLA